MEVWIAQWDYAYDDEHNVTVWASEAEALKSVCDQIEDNITNNWDMDNEEQSQCADEITALQSQNKYREIIQKWNDYQSESDDDHAEYWSVSRKNVLTGDGEAVTLSPPAVYKPTTSGATCRGPCGLYNNYALADRADGTHVCYQCSTFQHIFGVKS